MIDELYLRDNVIEKARSLYIPNITNNISIALEMFLKNDATENEKVPLVISRETRPANWVDVMGRPKCPRCSIGLSLNVNKNLWQCDICGFKINIKIKNCPECNRSMMLKPVNVSRCTKVDGNYNSVWTCRNKECMETIYNEKTIQEILTDGGANGIS
jgi:ribosomal protein S27AE